MMSLSLISNYMPNPEKYPAPSFLYGHFKNEPISEKYPVL